MQPLRIRFEKKGRARFISHLDLNRCMSRALKRAGIPAWYTQGFNPHPYITFALPLSLFYESDCEVMDMRLDGEMSFEEVRDRLHAEMPEGIRILEAVPPQMKTTEITYATYTIELEYPDASGEMLENAWRSLLALPTIPIEKKTKRGMHDIDVRPFLVQAETAAHDGVLSIRATLPAGQSENLNPGCFAAALARHAGLEPYIDHICRTGIFDTQMHPFV
ncbi:MAG: TIGR03936 family radical SAM-associated protein [Ethanoligenens sp.]